MTVAPYSGVVQPPIPPFTDFGSGLVEQPDAAAARAYMGMADAYPIIVSSKADLPAAVGGVITLPTNNSYIIAGDVDLTGDRLVVNSRVAIMGASTENCSLRSTGLSASTALITSQWNVPLRFISITHGTALNLDATANPGQALDWFNVNFINCDTIGLVKNYTNALLQTIGMVNCGPITFDGTFDTIGFAQSLIQPASGKTAIVLPSTLTVTRRFRMSYSAVVVAPGRTGINVSASATIPSEGYILDTVNFSGGGTYTTGVTYLSNAALWTNNRGIINTAPAAQITMSGNATVTTISNVATPVKIAGTTVAGPYNQKFTASNNRLTYTGSLIQLFRVSTIQSFTTGNGNQVGVYIAKNGVVIDSSETYATADGLGRRDNSVCQALVEMSQNDYLETWIENATTTNNITVTDLSLLAEAVG